MKIEYICHACLFVDTGDVKIATDPWFNGPAYCNQWHVFPKPVNESILSNADVILVSHGHEDHLHENSLRQLPKRATVFYPYTWFAGTPDYLKSLGFNDVTEARHMRTYYLTTDTSVTYVVNRMDSVMVIESKGEVFININDALHSAPPGVVDPFVRELKRRWPNIDTVFCGFGGASYFPNTIHCPGKRDAEIGEAREELFARNFCRIVQELNPKVAVPFAADFALLSPRQRWINDIRFPRLQLPAYFKKLYPLSPDRPQIQPMFPGDVLNSTELVCKSPYRSQIQEGNSGALLKEQYQAEILESEKSAAIRESEAEILERELIGNLKLRVRLFESSVLNKISFTVKVSDISERPYFNISLSSGQPVVERSSARSADSILELECNSSALRYSFATVWGGDALTIGYACEIQVFNPETITSNLDTICVRLLTRHPSKRNPLAWEQLEPVRWMRHMLDGPAPAREYSKNALNEITRETLFRPKCEACRACDYLFDGQDLSTAKI
jgi:hypothetical protein